jgi:hypothetical protein
MVSGSRLASVVASGIGTAQWQESRRDLRQIAEKKEKQEGDAEEEAAAAAFKVGMTEGSSTAFDQRKG